MGEAGKGTDVSRIARVCVTQLDVVAGAVFANRQEIGGSNEENTAAGAVRPLTRTFNAPFSFVAAVIAAASRQGFVDGIE